MELTAPLEYRELTARSLPQSKKYMCSAAKGQLELNAMLDMLEVRLIVIRPHK